MEDKTKMMVSVMIVNAFVLAVFAMLAIIFHKWWIVLLSCLFFDRLKTTKRMWCDGCGESIYGSSMREVYDESKRRHWKKIKHGDTFLDACPNCYDSMLKKERAESMVTER